jgi:hypothetical protein
MAHSVPSGQPPVQRSLLLLLALTTSRAHAEAPHLPSGQAAMTLPAGYSRVVVAVRPGSLTSLLVLGDQGALAHFALDPALAPDALEEDALLPRAASFVVPPGVEEVAVSVEVDSPARLVRVEAAAGEDTPTEGPPLIGFPAPTRRDDGYLLERSGRYQFARPDVVTLLRGAFADTRRRFRRDPIGLVDLSQWDAFRPAIDQGKPRHVSHEGGRDVDIALPSTLEPSTHRDHCDKLISRDLTTGLCRRSTARHVDYLRLAFLLGRLVKTGHVDRIFLDTEFIGPTAEAARKLIHPPGYPAWVAERLQPPNGIVRHVAWHTDHVHVRFLGPRGVSALRAAGELPSLPPAAPAPSRPDPPPAGARSEEGSAPAIPD